MAGDPHLDDDEPARMTVRERMVWASLVAVVVSSGAYVVLMVSRLSSRPVTEISWVAPMLWTMGLAIVGSIVLTIAFAIIAGIDRRGGCPPATADEVISDVRDLEIGERGGRAATGVIGVGVGGALALSMLDAHPFWIGNLLFLFGTVGTVVETVTKIRLYRRGF